MNTQNLNELIELGQGQIRSLDCVIAVALSSSLDEANLIEKIKKAQQLFPETGIYPVVLSTSTSLEAFTNLRISDPKRLELAMIPHEEQTILALKMSHLLGDAVSMLLWLEAILSGKHEAQELELRSFPRKKDTPYRSLRNSQVWMDKYPETGLRNIETLTLKHSTLSKTYTLNDILIHALFKSLPLKRKSIWVPVNVRKKFWSGFGNGLSRMRIYPLRNGSLREELDFIRKQKNEAFKNGEIALPPEDLDLSTPLKKMLFKCWLNRPWADWGSLSLSHIEDKSLRFKETQGLWGVTNLIQRHQAGLFAWSTQNETFLTLTLDKSVPRQEGKELLHTIKRHFEEIQHELTHE